MMKRAIPTVSILILFAGSAAGSWFLYASKEDEREPGPAVTEVPMRVPSTPEAQTDKQEDDGQLPVAVRPRPISAEDIYRLGNVIRNREETLKKREKQVEVQENRLKLMSEDIHAEQVALEALQAKVQGLTDSAESLLARITAEKDEADRIHKAAEQEREEFEKSKTEADDSQAQNIRRMAEWFQNMEPEKAAEYLRGLSNNGQLSMAVQLLGNFEERDAAAILAAMDDTELVGQLTQEFKTLKRPQKKKR